MKMNDIVKESMEITPQQRQIAALGQILMSQAPGIKDDGLSNIMATVGNELSSFGTPFGASNIKILNARQVLHKK